MNPSQFSQNNELSIWLDQFERSLIVSGQLQQWIVQGRVQAVLTDFVSLERSLHTPTYDRDIRVMQQLDVRSLYDYISIRDAQLAADLLKRVHTQTRRVGGYVVLALPPEVWSDPQAAVTEARRLWQAIGWSNLMLSLPATPTMFPVIEQLISEEINVNVMPIYTQTAYEQVTAAYFKGLEALIAQGGSRAICRVASIISLPIADLDEAIDAEIMAQLETARDRRAILERVLGTVAIAQAQLIDRASRRFYQSDRWQSLASAGANQQQLLWFITKSQSSRSNFYREAMSGLETAIGGSSESLNQFHQCRYDLPRANFQSLGSAQKTLRCFEENGFAIEAISDRLLNQHMEQSQEAFQHLLKTLAQKQQALEN